jgi:hypothetical protein
VTSRAGGARSGLCGRGGVPSLLDHGRARVPRSASRPRGRRVRRGPWSGASRGGVAGSVAGCPVDGWPGVRGGRYGGPTARGGASWATSGAREVGSGPGARPAGDQRRAVPGRRRGPAVRGRVVRVPLRRRAGPRPVAPAGQGRRAGRAGRPGSAGSPGAAARRQRWRVPWASGSATSRATASRQRRPGRAGERPATARRRPGDRHPLGDVEGDQHAAAGRRSRWAPVAARGRRGRAGEQARATGSATAADVPARSGGGRGVGARGREVGRRSLPGRCATSVPARARSSRPTGSGRPVSATSPGRSAAAGGRGGPGKITKPGRYMRPAGRARNRL